MGSHETLPFVDTDSAAFMRDPAGASAEAGAVRGIARGPHGVEVFAYDQVRALLTDKRLRPPSAAYFQGRGATAPILEFINDGLLLMMDPARHEKLRKILVKGFRPRTIDLTRPMMAAFAEELVSGFSDRRTIDFVADFSHHYSIGVIARYIGVEPADVPIFDSATVELRVLAENPMTPHVSRLEKALAELRVYTRGLVAARRENPRPDLISDLIEAQELEGRMTETELIWAVVNVLLAGHDTTRYQLASCVRALVEAGAWERVAADPGLIPFAVDEGMRLWPVTTRVVRLVTEPMEICGEAFDVHEPVALSFQAAGRDPAVFAEPNGLNLGREPGWDIGFGRGAHYCLGHAVARTEMCEALAVLTRRLTDVELADEIVMPPDSAAFMRGPASLPLAYAVRPAIGEDQPEPVLEPSNH
ncbi:Biotin biosynthesis cytochrome P450 [Frankia canadensis]|uniref:Biotin biosynthesis cytochrome P450 n=1 Tax=Frankia canadensis TaxID=1836972 RepID=A0A2I2KLM7_9ACTN|nr:cytochrome P450 [Frankia canadensis]SNQ46567.1 Biotin biosynthesis cytochrome P450 [Frankia canadensis]SOU53857.1 Biotin biosynthesis cytochrome P450 [Frankia canadensis]